MTTLQVKNIVISGTNMWNPGDDWVRDGVIRLLHEVFSGYQLNFLFYNFNQDFFPQSKFTGITNMVSKDDLNRYRDFIDAIVIAGLSAGNEIKDLYNWVIQNKLYDRVYLIGAGYENSYVERYISQEPEATIFINARIITSRTRKAPQFIFNLNLPFHHINCPALLSVPSVKDVPPGKKISRIGLSIQLPHEQGILNHCCSRANYDLSLKILLSLKTKYEVEVIAHHKSEYFYFLNLLKGRDIPVIFSSFYHDLFNIYPRYDLLVTTRLHASLFANGFGIPGIIINDTDRHTHCLEGFPHSVWVNSLDAFNKEFNRISSADLHAIAKEAEYFKSNLLKKYVEILREPFGIASKEQVALPKPNMSALLYNLGLSEVKQRVLNIISRLTADVYLARNIENFKKAIEKDETWFDSVTFLNWYAKTFKPANYLEVGVRRGRSMAQVITQSPGTNCFGFDMWIPNYSGVDNPGPEFVLNEFKKLGVQSESIFIKGNSHETLPRFWADPTNPQLIDLIYIDGDHTYRGAKEDLDIAFSHLAPGGAMLFDDISHPSHPELYPLWNEYKHRFPDYLFIEDRSGNGTACAFKPPFTRLEEFLKDKADEPASHLNVANSAISAQQIQRSAKMPEGLPVHFFTIVLNGAPFIRHHIDVFRGLPFKWHWHIIEGVADLKHDTAWSAQSGGKITDEFHHHGLSNDGTTEYLNELAKQFPDNITIYRKPGKTFWNGKLEMVNAPLKNIQEECLLWQVDVDEYWTTEQISTAHNLFLRHSKKTAAYYLCNFFVGPELVTTTRNTYGNHTDYEWLRTWRYKPRDRWITHEPPRLCRRDKTGKWIDLAKIDPLMHADTEANHLVFNHFAYVNEQQLRFKEIYYGYKNAVESWQLLQSASKFPIFLKDYFPWVNDETLVDRAQSFDDSLSNTRNILWIRADSIGDNVMASAMLSHIKAGYPNAKVTVLCQNHIAELYESSPFVDAIIGFDRLKGYQDASYRNQIIQKLKTMQMDLALNTLYSRDALYDIFAIKCGARTSIAFNGDLCNIPADVREANNQHYTKIITDREKHKTELERHHDYLAAIGIHAPPLQPTVWLTSEDEQYADNLFNNNGFTSEKTVGLFVCGQWVGKYYEHYVAALSRILQDQGMSVLALGADTDRDINQKIIEHLGIKSFNLAGQTTLRQTAAILKRCCLGVGADTGSAHLACAVGTPNVVLLGGGHFGRFMPYSPLTSVVCLPLECYDCNWQCKYKRVHCIKDIHTAVIAEAVRQTLDKQSVKPRIFVQGTSLWEPKPENPRWQSFHSFLNMADVDIIPVGDIPTSTADLWKKLISMNPAKQSQFLQEAADEFIRHGEKMFSYDDLKDAEKSFFRALELQPDSAEALNNLGVLQSRTGHYDKAGQYYEAAVRNRPDNATFAKNLADFYYVIRKDTEKALQMYIKSMSINPTNPEILMALGNISIENGQMDSAKDFFQRLIAIDPTNEDAGKILSLLSNQEDKAADDIEILSRNDDASKEYLVTALVSTYNSERFIRGCLEDLEAQTIADQIEIIIIDSASPQNERTIVEEFQKRYNNIVYIRTRMREKLYAAWNRGIRMAKGKYITNTNTDDRRLPHALETEARALNQFPDVGLVYADIWGTSIENDILHGDDTKRFTHYSYFDFSLLNGLTGSNFSPQPMWRKSVHQKIGYFDEDYVIAGDYEFFFRIARQFNALHIKAPLGLYLENTSGIEKSQPELTRKEFTQLREKFYSEIRLEEFFPQLSANPLDRQAQGHAFFELGNNFLMASMVPEYQKALDHYEKAKEILGDHPRLMHNMAIALLGNRKLAEATRILRENVVNFLPSGKILKAVESHKTDIDQLLQNGCTVYFSEHPIAKAARKGLGIDLQDITGQPSQIDPQPPIHQTEGMGLAVMKALELSEGLYFRGEVDRAVEALVDCIKIAPEAAGIYHMLVRIFLETKRFGEAWAVIETIPDAARNDLRTLECSGYAKEGLGVDDEANQCAKQMLARQDNYAPALNLKGVLAYKKGDKNTARTYFEKAIVADPGYGDAYTNLGVLDWSLDQKEEAFSYLQRGFILCPTVPDNHSLYHTVASSLDRQADAEADFREACRLYPCHKNLAFLYIDLLLQQEKDGEAILKIEDALDTFGLDEEMLKAALAVREKIGPLQISPDKKHTLSLCMIVKNEEKHLVKCLKSVRDVVDEMIIVDTGSTDKTQDIAKVFGAKLFDFPWTGDFSAARNESLQYASGEWILVLDADEAISELDFEHLKNLISKKPAKPSAYSIVTRNYVTNASFIGWTRNTGQYPQEAGSGWVPSAKVRLIPNRKGLFFSDPIHETLEASLKKANIPALPARIVIHHFGRLKESLDRQKGEDYYRIGKAKYESDPTNMKYILEMAKQAQVLNRCEEAVDLWLKLIALLAQKRKTEVYKELKQIMNNQPEAEAYTQLASAYLELERFDEALSVSRKALTFGAVLKEYVIINAQCEIIAGSIETALINMQKLLNITPEYPPALLLEAVVFSLEGKKEDARKLFELLAGKRVQIAPPVNKLVKQLHKFGKNKEALMVLNAVIEFKINNEESLKLLTDYQK